MVQLNPTIVAIESPGALNFCWHDSSPLSDLLPEPNDSFFNFSTAIYIPDPFAKLWLAFALLIQNLKFSVLKFLLPLVDHAFGRTSQSQFSQACAQSIQSRSPHQLWLIFLLSLASLNVLSWKFLLTPADLAFVFTSQISPTNALPNLKFFSKLMLKSIQSRSPHQLWLTFLLSLASLNVLYWKFLLPPVDPAFGSTSQISPISPTIYSSNIFKIPSPTLACPPPFHSHPLYVLY